MFSKIEDGLQIYKAEVEEFVKTSCVIEKREGADREARGLAYRSRLDWPEEDFKWLNKAGAVLEGMAKVLGLSRDEDQAIWRAVSEKLDTKTNPVGYVIF